MPVFNTRIAVTFQGESAKLVAGEFEKMTKTVDGHLSRMRQSMNAVSGDLKSFKNLFGKTAAGFFIFDAMTKSLDAADKRFGLLNDSGREFVKNLNDMSAAARSFDVAGFAAGAGASLGNLLVLIQELNEQWQFFTSGGKFGRQSDADLDAEFRRNLENAKKSNAYNSAGTADLRRQVFGDPEQLKKEAANLVKAINEQIRQGLDGVGNDQSKGAVKKLLDGYHAIGEAVPADLAKVASAWGVVSSATEKAREEAKRTGERTRKEAEEIADALRQGNAVIDKLEVPGLIETFQKGLDPAFAADLERAGSLLDEFGISTRDWSREIQFVDENWKRLGISEERAKKLIAAMKAEVGELDVKSRELVMTWQSFTVGDAVSDLVGSFTGAFSEGIRAALHDEDPIDAFVENLKAGLENTLFGVFDNLASVFGEQLAKEIAKAIAAQQASNAANGTSGGYMGAIAGVFKGGSSAGGFLAAAWPVLAVAAFMVGAKWYSDKQEKKRYGSTANVGMSGPGSFWAIGSGRNPGSSGEMAKGILDLLHELEGATGTFITGMDQVLVNVRNDKKRFEVVGVGVFKSMEEALVAAAKHAFLNADLSGEVAPAMRQMLENFKAKTVDELRTAISFVSQIVNEASGLSDIELHLREIPALIRSVNQQLIEFGVSVGEAMSLSTQWGVQQFQAAWASISGQQLTPKQELAQKKAQAALLVAQIKLWQLELTARKNFLIAQAKLASAETGHRKAVFEGRVVYMRAESNLNWAHARMTGDYLNVRGKLVQAEANIWQAEIDVITEALKAIDALLATIDIGKIRVGGGRRGGAGGGRGGAANDNSLWDALLGSQSALSPERQMQIALQHFRSLKGDAQRDFASTLLDEAQGFFGNATLPYAKIYEEVIKAIGGEKYLSGNSESDARKKTVDELLALAAAANQAAAALGGKRKKAQGSTGGSTSLAAGTQSAGAGGNTLTAALEGLFAPVGTAGAASPTSGSGSSRQIVSALQRQTEIASATKDILEGINSNTRTRVRSMSRTAPAPTPAPAPAATGGTLGTRDGIGGVGKVA